MLPTHFFCCKNDSSFTKADLHHLTFALCHFYFNWPGPIKVPAPCMYAHQIAQFFMNLGRAKQNYKKVVSREAESVKEDVAKVQPLCKRLYFL